MLKCLLLFYVFFKIGMFSFGGGYVMLPMIYQEIQKFGIMTSHEFSNVVALSQMTPGPIAVNAATYVGYKAAGMASAIAATIGVSLPSFIIIIVIAAFMNKFKENPVVQSILLGIRPATVGMIASAVIFFAKTSIVVDKIVSIPAVIIFILTLIGSEKLKLGPITLTVLAGIAGILLYSLPI